MVKDSICCVGVVEITIKAAKRNGCEWKMRLGFGSVEHTEQGGMALQKKALELTKKEVEKNPEKYGFEPGEEICYRTSIDVLACEQIIGYCQKTG